ncbi:hypothetical protein EGH25_11750 [Haladaptatus sp. F3-133]|uniref:Uncharacterized protein n=1 Tax=Halorutilus salinus TaxID=2487751 RepID=A0A9Q4C852_9EURY|nr:hypothetical protein [Halorutilus salinus]MCX2820021.1 hypothetical protein [Halorutilus salinus]
MLRLLIFPVVPEALTGIENRRYIKTIHEENLDRLRNGEPVYLPDAGEAEESLSGRTQEYHGYTKEEIRKRGEKLTTTDSGAELYRLREEVRRDVEDLTERTSAKIKRQNRRVYIATFVIGVLVFGPLISFISLIL